MISVSKRNWQEVKINENIVKKTQQVNDFSNIISRLVVARKFDDEEIYSIKNYTELSNKFRNNLDFINSSKLVEEAINKKEKVCILGDYDVDGSAATALFIKFFEKLKHPYFYYIPDRVKDGYGASKKLFQKLIKKKIKLIIMVDCGSTSNEAIDFLNKNKIKSLIIDHHEINKPYPKSNEIINPKKNNGYIEYDYLCTTTLTYFFLEILALKVNCKINLRKHLIYVLLATVCDVMPLRKLNRLISIIALKEFNIKDNYFIKKIYELSNKKNKLNINDLGFLIGPILNAGGRLSKSNYATELLSTTNHKIIDIKSTELIRLNSKRKKIESNILNTIDFNVIENDNKDVIILYDQNINEGLIGIIASRLKEYFNKPSIVITNSNNLLKSSARSVPSYNIGKAIKRALDKNIILSGGGHNMAAGFTLKKNSLDFFKAFINEDFLKNSNNIKTGFTYDSEISFSGINKDFFDDINKLQPFGTGNRLPIFLLKELKVIKKKILDSKHISCLLKSKTGKSISSICFNSLNTKVGTHLLNYKKDFNVVGQINENFWDSKKTLQLIIIDLIL
tara:strand:+ start:409 stop:2103 length:1695 start_codon:yes stop_codon:yes gene_type:complete